MTGFAQTDLIFTIYLLLNVARVHNIGGEYPTSVQTRNVKYSHLCTFSHVNSTGCLQILLVEALLKLRASKEWITHLKGYQWD